MGMPQDQLMSLIQSQRDSATPGGLPPTPEAAGPGDAGAPPMSAPMSTPEPKMGNREAAMINVSMALDLLEQSLPALGSETPEGKSILQVLRKKKPLNCNRLKFCSCYRPCLKRVAHLLKRKQWRVLRQYRA